jgi:hypothetical protein
LFTNNHWLKNCPFVGVYACSKDGKPKGRTGSNWHLDNYDAKEVSKSKPQKLSFRTKELEDKEEAHTRKKMKPHNHEKGMPGLNKTTATPPLTTAVSSLASSVHLNSSSTSYWHS